MRLERPASDDGSLSGRSPAARARWLALLALVLASATSPACVKAPDETPGSGLTWVIAPQPPRVGPAVVALTLTDAGKLPVTGARVSLEGLMTHPGMAPVVAQVEEGARGLYEARFDFTMAGDWILLVRADWTGGGRLERRLAVRVAP